MSITVRALKQDDIHAVLTLWAETEGLGTGPGDSFEGIVKFIDRNPGCSLVATQQSEIIGVILCGHDGRRGQIYRLSVAHHYRRRGVATALAQHSLDKLAQEGILRCLLFVVPGNEGARAFWESMGGRARDLQMYAIDVDGARPRSVRCKR